MADFKTVIIVALIILGVSTGLFAFTNELFKNYDTSLEGNVSKIGTDIQRALDDTSSLTKNLEANVSQSGGISFREGFTIAKDTVLAGLKLPFKLIGLIGSLISTIAITFGLPLWTKTVAIGVLIVIIVATFLSIIFRTRV